MIRVVHITTALSASGAGVHEAILGLVQAIRTGHDVDVRVAGVVTDSSAWEQDGKRWNGVSLSYRDGRGWKRPARLMESMAEIDPRSVDLVHAHGLWDGAVAAGSRLSTLAECPLIVSPHGMLEPWAIRHNWPKKMLPWILWERQLLASADVLEAKSHMEASGFRMAGLHNIAAVIPVGVDIPDASDRPPGNQDVGERRCVFLSRLHYKKGVDILLEAWARAQPLGWRLIIAGPDESGLRADLERQASKLGIVQQVDFVGPVHGTGKWSLLQSAELFVLPSRSENFGIVVPEALAVGVPCIATTATPWGLLDKEQLGWSVPPSAGPLATALSRATAMDRPTLAARGRRGREFVKRNFSWAAVASETASLYRWILNRGSPPRCVVPSNAYPHLPSPIDHTLPASHA